MYLHEIAPKTFAQFYFGFVCLAPWKLLNANICPLCVLRSFSYLLQTKKNVISRLPINLIVSQSINLKRVLFASKFSTTC